MKKKVNEFAPLTLLLLLIIPGNLFPLHLFFGVDFIFGNIPVFLIAFIYGPLWALFAGILSSGVSYFLWGHLMVSPVFISEALMIALLFKKRKKGNPIDYVIVYWFTLGIPVSFLAYRLGMGQSMTIYLMTVSKQFINSVFSASICGLLLYCPLSFLKLRKEHPSRRLVPAYNLFSSVFVIFMVSTVILILVVENRDFEKRSVNDVKSRLITINNSLITHLNSWKERNQFVHFRMSYEVGQILSGSHTAELQGFLEKIHSITPDHENLYVGNREGIAIAFSPKLSLQGEFNIGKDLSDRAYYKQVLHSQAPVFSHLLISRDSSEPIVGIASPVLIDGDFKGYLFGGLKLDGIESSLREFQNSGEQTLTLIDPDGKVIVSTGKFKTMDLFRTEEKGTRKALGEGVIHWFPEDAPSAMQSYKESFLYYKSAVPDLNWTIYIEESFKKQADIFLNISLRNNLIAILLILILLPLMKISLRGFRRILEHLIEVSMRQANDPLPDSEWPKTSILELHNLIKRIRNIVEDQRTSSYLMQEQNNKLSGMNAALVRSEENLRITMASIGDGVLVTDAKGKIVNLNPVASSLSGWSLEDALHHNIEDILNLKEEFSGITPSGFLDRVLNRGTSLVSGKVYILKDLDGNVRNITLGAEPIRISQESEIRGAVIVIRDISESRRLEEQLRQAQKMEVIGQLAGGIAHDFNNLMAGIIGLNEMILSDLPEDSPACESSQGISTLVGKAADLTRKLLAFSRKGKMTSKVFDVHEVIDITVDILERTINKSIHIEKNLDAKSFNIAGDPTQIQSVFMNIALNARDAMPEGGTLSFITDLTRGLQSVETSTGIKMITGPHICITIRDTGEGIDKESFPHIFEPFFTTKGVGQGSGMGLPAVFGAVSEHNGMIEVKSEVGKGTTFNLYFPIAQSRKILYEPDELAIMRGEETILVIDDEEIIRNSLRAILSELGYNVYIASGGLDGLEMYKARESEISLIILDAVMADMSGLDVLNALKEIDPLVRVIIATGYSSESRSDQFRDAGALDFIPKPFTIDDLNNRIRRVLNS